MLLQNLAPRLITIPDQMTLTHDEKGRVHNAEIKKHYKLMPAGDAVEVPDRLCGKFVDALIKQGALKALSEKAQAASGFGVEEIIDLPREAPEAEIIDLPREALPEQGYKLCNKCDTELPVSDFGKLSSAKDGLNSTCKQCRSVKARGKK